MQRTASVNVPPRELMVGDFLISEFWKASLIFKNKAEEMVIGFSGKESNSYFSDITE